MVVKVTLSDLLPQILTHILLHLPFTLVVTCRRINRHLQAHISTSTRLQYYIHLGIYGLVDNPLCALPIPERLDQLLTRRRRWEDFDLDFSQHIEVPFQFRSSDTKLTPGVFSAIAGSEESHYIRVPSVPDQGVKWRQTPSENKIISPGACVYEHDLHIIVTAQPIIIDASGAGSRITHQVQVHLNRLSTGEPHSDAPQVTISFETHEEFGDPRILVECAGDNLVLTLRDRATRNKPKDQVYVYGWKTGELKLRLSAPFRAHLHALYLTTDIFLLPNSQTGELEYWRIPQSASESTSHQPFFILSLPCLRSGSTFRSIDSRAEPNPGIQPTDPSKPFYTDPHSAIAVFMVVIETAGFISPSNFILFVHRSSLVEYIDKFSAFTSRDDRPKAVPYVEWGPPVCRWFEANSMDWLATTFGQTYITPPKGEPGGEPITLLDFNPIAVARAVAAEKHRLEAKGSDDDGRGTIRNEGKTRTEGTRGVVTQTMDPLNGPDGCFENTIYSSLPYTVRSSRNKYSFDELLLDEEGILGILMSSRERIEGIQVLHYG
ncbi:hypothetical protein P691DRAFT_805703 [Macrolepiota fuliginosa MF-IS2]|uniref:F-box domain-containing protein n=1 Tax=Macrolepiota fuliginosa MF-IS2 TaxID=1400762 RepID=A0A9P5X972_9AGAR|nr:hypothetical protein P691DRAFT_805703 [Macrolepiota fuliginosa MF-IS2]